MTHDDLQPRIEVVQRALQAFGTSANQRDSAEALVAALRRTDLPSVELASLLAHEVSTWGNATRVTGTEILNAFIQTRLTREHVEAQNKASNAADRLSKTNNRLAAAAVFFAVIQIIIAALQLRGCS